MYDNVNDWLSICLSEIFPHNITTLDVSVQVSTSVPVNLVLMVERARILLTHTNVVALQVTAV